MLHSTTTVGSEKGDFFALRDDLTAKLNTNFAVLFGGALPMNGDSEALIFIGTKAKVTTNDINAYGIKLYAGFNLFMLGDLKLGGSFLGTFWDTNNASNVSFGVKAGYTMGDLELGVGVKLVAASVKYVKDSLYLDEYDFGYTSFSIPVDASYAIIPGTLKASLGLNIEFYDVTVKYNGTPGSDVKLEESIFEITPKVEYTVAPGASMTLGHTLGFSSSKVSGKAIEGWSTAQKDAYNDTNNPVKSETTITFKWSF